MMPRVTRRDVLKGTAALAATAAISTGPAIGAVGDGKLRIALIGCGGRGRSFLPAICQHRLVALADPDQGSLNAALQSVSQRAESLGIDDPARIKTYSDYRQMFDTIHKDIDAVFIATPDHQHACPSMMAIKLGKHVFCEKPLVHHIGEARVLGQAARESQVVTQMGNQGSGTGGHQTLAEYLQAGAIGALREVHGWHVFASRFGGSMAPPPPEPVPQGLNWDAWLGPAAERPYSSVYRPWHGWCDFGTGSLGGWGTHVLDAIYFALKLGPPSAAELIDVLDPSEDRFPRASTVRYDFPQRGDLSPISVYWYEGAKPNVDGLHKGPDGKPTQTMPHRPELAAEIERQSGKAVGSIGAGSIFVGERGMIFCGSHGGAPVIFPESRRAEFTVPPRELPRAAGGITGDFFAACAAGGGPTFSGFDTFAGPFLEMCLVGHLAMFAGLNRPVQWDGVNLRCTNRPELDQFVKREYRAGWTL
jgi:predicted dehydrogenase